MRTLEEELAFMARAYPTLFRTRERALDHLYLVIGNGYEWEDGRLVSVCPEGPAFETLEEWLDHKVARCTEEDHRLYKMIHGGARQFFQSMLDKADTPLTTSYPFHERYALASEVPDDVQPDYLDGAAEALANAIDIHFANQDFPQALRVTEAYERLVVRFPQLLHKALAS